VKKRNILILIVVAAAIVALIFIPKGSPFPGGGQGGPGAPGTAPGRARMAFTIRSEEALRGNLQSRLLLNGDIDFAATIDVYPDTAGRIESLEVKVGDKVKQGQRVARIDPSRPGERYELSPVNAPADGTIVALNLPERASVSVQSPIMRIAKSDELEITARVNERDIAVLVPGLKAMIGLEAWPGVSFAATLTQVSPYVDPASRTKAITLVLDKKDPRVFAGMYAKISLDTVLHRDLVIVSSDAVATRYSETFVWVLKEDATVERRPVVVGVSVDGKTAIREGLQGGERIVVEGLQVLSDGAAVRDVAIQAQAGKPAGDDKAAEEGSATGKKDNQNAE